MNNISNIEPPTQTRKRPKRRRQPLVSSSQPIQPPTFQLDSEIMANLVATITKQVSEETKEEQKQMSKELKELKAQLNLEQEKTEQLQDKIRIYEDQLESYEDLPEKKKKKLIGKGKGKDRSKEGVEKEEVTEVDTLATTSSTTSSNEDNITIMKSSREVDLTKQIMDKLSWTAEEKSNNDYLVQVLRHEKIEQIDSSQNRIEAETAARRQFRAENPQKYTELKACSDYDPNMFSTTSEGKAVYVKGMSMKMQTSYGVVFTDTTWSKLNASQKSRYKKDGARINYVTELGRSYKSCAVAGLLNKTPVGEVDSIEKAKKKQLTHSIKLLGIDKNFRKGSGFTTDYDTYFCSQLKQTTSNLKVCKMVTFNGLITRATYSIDEAVYSDNNFNSNVFNLFIKKAVSDLILLNENYHSFTVKINYRNLANSMRFTHTTHKELGELIGNKKPLYMFLSEAISMAGSDPTEDVTTYSLDISSFSIEMLDLYRSGGVDKDNKDNKAITTQSKSKSFTAHQLDWCYARSYRSKTSGCFVNILIRVLKEKKLTNQKNFLGLWKELDKTFQTETIRTPTDIETAHLWCGHYKITLVVHNHDGDITDPKSLLNNKIGNNLRVMLNEGHYYHILKLTDRYDPSSNLLNQLEKVKRVKYERTIEKLVYYDLETVNTTDISCFSLVKPYVCTYCIDKVADLSADDCIDKVADKKEDPIINYVDILDTDVVLAEMIDSTINNSRDEVTALTEGWNEEPGNLESGGKLKIVYKFIAFNGSKFDHGLLFTYLTAKGYIFVAAPAAVGKLRHMTVHLISHKVDIGEVSFEIPVFLEIWDPCLFVQGSLRNVAKSFNLKTHKGDLDHEMIQSLSAKGELRNWLKVNRKEVRQYAIKDVEVLRLLVIELLKVDKDILKFQTIAGMCFYNWKTWHALNSKKEDPKMIAVSDYVIDGLIRSAIIGGRVEGVVGVTTKLRNDLVMVDVVSLYPTVMANRIFPVGKEQLYFGPTGGIIEGKIGIYYCRWDQSPMEGVYQHPILPVRYDTLNWKKFSAGEGYLPQITMRDLLRAGAKISIANPPKIMIEDEDGDLVEYQPPRAIIWESGSKVFSNYVNEYKKMKENEDNKKAAGRPWNPVLREMSKTNLNSLGGKMVQKNYLDGSKMYQERDEAKLRAKLALDKERRINIDLVNSKTTYVKWKKTTKEAYKRPYPSQLGVFIYAYARSLMWNEVFKKVKVYYTDTDSAIVSRGPEGLGKLNNVFIPGVTKGNKKFGQLEVEAECSKLIVIAPKMYMLQSESGEVIKWRLKGVRPDDSWIRCGETEEKPKIIKDTAIELFNALLEGDIEVKTWSFRMCHSKGMVRRLDTVKVLKGLSPSSISMNNELVDEVVGTTEGVETEWKEVSLANISTSRIEEDEADEEWLKKELNRIQSADLADLIKREMEGDLVGLHWRELSG